MTTVYKFKAGYTKLGVATNPSSAPVITVVDKDNNALVTAAATTTRATLAGVYEYTYTGADNLDPVGMFHTTDTTMDAQDIFSYTEESVVAYQNTSVGSGYDYSSSTDAFADMSEGNYSSSDYPQMASFITAASAMIDAEIGVWRGFFNPSATEVTRYYNGSGESEQIIDPFAGISAVYMSEAGGVGSTDYTLLSSSDYFFYPYNYAENNKPITKIIMDTINGSQFGSFYSFRKAVKVVGVAGYATTIDPRINQACKMQSIRWFMRAKQGYQDTGANVEVGQMMIKGTLQLDPDVRQLLYPFKLEFS